MSFRICVLGCGGLSTREHGPSFRRYADLHSDVELAACCDLDEARAELYQRTFGFSRRYNDLKKMLDTEKPDAVALIVPPAATAGLAVQIMRMGYPVIMEKPPGINIDECRLIVAAAEETGVPNQVSFNRRYTPLGLQLRTMLAELPMSSQVANIRYDFHRINRRDADFSATSIHGIDAVRFLAMSDYKRIDYHYQELSGEPRAFNIFMDCTMASGVTTQLNFCPVTGVTLERATVTANGHTFFLHMPMGRGLYADAKLMHVEAGQILTDVSVPYSDRSQDAFGFYGENAAFFGCLRSGQKPEPDVKTALQSVIVAEYMREQRPFYEAE